MMYIPLNTFHLPSEKDVSKKMLPNLRKKASIDKIKVKPYVLLCPRETCKSKLLYLQGANLVYKPENEDKLIPYAMAHRDSEAALEYSTIPSDVLLVINNKRKIMHDKLARASTDSSDTILKSRVSTVSTSSASARTSTDSSATKNNSNANDPPSENGKTEVESKVDRQSHDLEDKNTGKTTSGFYWCVSDVFKFENVGLSKPTDGDLRFLICADCECGPLGYHLPEPIQQKPLVSSGSQDEPRPKELEYLVSISRVRYQQV